MQYSVYYGETFDCEGSCQHQRTSVTKSYYMRDLGDVDRFPRNIHMHQVIEQFEHIFNDSAASVHSVINYVILLRRLIEKPKGKKTYSGGIKTISI